MGEELWLLRALEGVLLGESYTEIKKANAALFIAQELIYFAVAVGQQENRKETLRTLAKMNEAKPVESDMLVEGLVKWFEDVSVRMFFFFPTFL